MPVRVRKSVAALCIAIAAFTLFVPAIAFDSPLAIITARWQLVPLPASSILPPVGLGSEDEKLVGYDSLLPTRAPPAG